MKTQKENVTFRIDHTLRQMLETIAQEERRSFSNQINLALDEWIQFKTQIHPQFMQSIKDALHSGKPEHVWKG